MLANIQSDCISDRPIPGPFSLTAPIWKQNALGTRLRSAVTCWSQVHSSIMAFKMPKLTLPGQNDTCSDISKFDWQDATIVEETASGTFGNVYLATYLATNKQIVVKQLRDQNRRESQRAFLKDARLLQNLEKNNNIADFVGLSSS